MKHTEMIKVIEAHSEGKAIQVKGSILASWTDIKCPAFDFEGCDYRVKPVSVYKRVQPQLVSCCDGGFVEIKALEDAMELIESHYNWPALSKAKIAALKELL